MGPVTNLAVGAAAGVINVMLTTPLWGVMTVLTTQRTRGLKDGQVSAEMLQVHTLVCVVHDVSQASATRTFH